jgi:hypothetical protein
LSSHRAATGARRESARRGNPRSPRRSSPLGMRSCCGCTSFLSALPIRAQPPASISRWARWRRLVCVGKRPQSRARRCRSVCDSGVARIGQRRVLRKSPGLLAGLDVYGIIRAPLALLHRVATAVPPAAPTRLCRQILRVFDVGQTVASWGQIGSVSTGLQQAGICPLTGVLIDGA